MMVMLKRRYMYIQAQSTTVSETFGDGTALPGSTTYHWRTIYHLPLENHSPLTIGEPSTQDATLHPCWCNDDSQDEREGLDACQ